MSWASLNLWENEQRLIHECITTALCGLIVNRNIISTDDELIVSGKLRPYLIEAKKKLKLSWVLQPEASCFISDEAPKPYGHPDIRFSTVTLDYEQYDYDIECKLVRIKRKSKAWDYCEHYVTDGIQRFQDGKYAKSKPAMGTMIGYVQEGKDIGDLLDDVNSHNQKQGYIEIQDKSSLCEGDVSHLTQEIDRKGDRFTLYHKWADLR